LTTHWRFAFDISRSVWIDGRATFTIVASRMTMNWARQTRTRTIQGLLPRAVIRGRSYRGAAGLGVRLPAPFVHNDADRVR
jgi:hypothetical protein